MLLRIVAGRKEIVHHRSHAACFNMRVEWLKLLLAQNSHFKGAVIRAKGGLLLGQLARKQRVLLEALSGVVDSNR